MSRPWSLFPKCPRPRELCGVWTLFCLSRNALPLLMLCSQALSEATYAASKRPKVLRLRTSRMANHGAWNHVTGTWKNHFALPVWRCTLTLTFTCLSFPAALVPAGLCSLQPPAQHSSGLFSYRPLPGLEYNLSRLSVTGDNHFRR